MRSTHLSRSLAAVTRRAWGLPAASWNTKLKKPRSSFRPPSLPLWSLPLPLLFSSAAVGSGGFSRRPPSTSTLPMGADYGSFEDEEPEELVLNGLKL